MRTSTIASAKNNLPQLIYDLESEEVIHLTRHGRPVAVMLSETNYQKLIRKNNEGVYSEIQKWHGESKDDAAFTDAELDSLRKNSAGREFSWDI